MKELCLVHSVRTKRGPLSVFRENERQRWERQSNGDYLLQIEGEVDEFLLPSTSVAYERRARAGKKP
jgi:hypothetical protein